MMVEKKFFPLAISILFTQVQQQCIVVVYSNISKNIVLFTLLEVIRFLIELQFLLQRFSALRNTAVIGFPFAR